MADRPLGPSAVLAALALAGPAAASVPAAPATLGLHAAQRSLLDALQTEVLLRRLSALQEKLDAVGDDLTDLRGEAMRLRLRADNARARQERDGFFPVDLARFREDLWRRALWMQDRRGEAERLRAEMPADRRLARKAGEAVKAAAQTADRVDGLVIEVQGLEAAVRAAARGLLGPGAAGDAAATRAQALDLQSQAAALGDALQAARERASGAP